VSLSVSVLDGFRSRRGELLDLSLTGARLRFDEPVTADRRPWLWLPAGLGGPLAHPIGGEVAWTDSLAGTPTGHCQVGFRFRRFPLGGRKRLQRVMSALLVRACEVRPLGPPPERRSSPRVAYSRRVVARGAGAPLVMLGRDLSSGGLSVETRRALAVGEMLEIALHAGGAVPLVVKAEVLRRTGDGQWALAFRDLGPAQQAQLEAILLAQTSPEPGASSALLVSRLQPQT
jgi:hypothetical protein